ncbi:DCC1-like thiol-disulfide oxidoreductase family protein [Streptomyces sp. TX20-6-3]|uniref:thiol-disulfide oxidoreductase DCC family protein n=1 Tax=Streptomyces sp. TX20-6-3 TaxID=3028705 RepID=UPI0029AFC079|nr:DCC1-like thiol-disulfide oxidoreductase family protein [Streptomyces sp. TX20-6-3]MDX2559806.1 DCC1-like thiol-disulfide oxidoreductase family protein [Streptomyces sp. TX20-6-3]
MPTPVGRLTVLYDADCPLCVHLRHWLLRQRQLVPLDLVPAGSQEARRRFPELDHGATLREITVVGDRGQVYRETSAWIVCLWALADHRAKVHWLATPAGQPFARVTVLAAAKWREALKGPDHETGPDGAGRYGAGPYGAAGCEDGRCEVPGPPG